MNRESCGMVSRNSREDANEETSYSPNSARTVGGGSLRRPANLYTGTHGHARSYSYGYDDSDANALPHLYPRSHIYPVSHVHPRAHPDSHAYAHGYCYPHGDSHTYSHGYAYSYPHRNACADGYTHSNPAPHFHANARKHTGRVTVPALLQPVQRDRHSGRSGPAKRHLCAGQDTVVDVEPGHGETGGQGLQR